LATKTPGHQNPPKTNIYCFLLWWTLVFLCIGGIFYLQLISKFENSTQLFLSLQLIAQYNKNQETL